MTTRALWSAIATTTLFLVGGAAHAEDGPRKLDGASPRASAAGGSSVPVSPTPPSAEELAAARELWTKGLELEKQKDFSGALSTFESVGKIRMTPQVRYHIGLESEQLGRLVDALNAYQLAIQEARQLGDKARDVLENTPPRIEALRGRVAKLRVTTTGVIRTSTLLLDDRKISAALLDVDIPVDPGQHTIEARRDGKIVDSKTVALREGGSEAVVLLVDDPKEVAPEPPTQATAPTSTGFHFRERWPAYATAGGGVALLATAGVFWGLRGATIANIRETCKSGDTGCNPEYQPTEDLGRAYTTTSVVLVGVGAAAVAAGATLWLVWPMLHEDAPPTAKAARIRPTLGVSPTANGLLLRGSF
ncbi:MAG: hypothetical protein FJ096_13030 [Deltaproteobacteria bacterium]|nr:hypothetical protein [Deltaproteobacteria bacterium]